MSDNTSAAKMQCYKSSGAKGYYYFIRPDGSGKLIPNQDKNGFALDLNKYEIIDADSARLIKADLRSNKPKVEKKKISYEGADVSNVCLRFTIQNIKDNALKHGFRCSPKAIGAYRATCRDCVELEQSLASLREKFPTENYIDYNIDTKRFALSKKLSVSAVAADLADLAI
jgi:hypothetical protein